MSIDLKGLENLSELERFSSYKESAIQRVDCTNKLPLTIFEIFAFKVIKFYFSTVLSLIIF